MSGPRTKRQFNGAAADPSQRQITNFFTFADLGTSASHAPREAPSRPAYPDCVQAGLIQVGMRIRKSVEEGYKTGDSSSVFKLFSDGRNPTDLARRHHPAGVSAASQRELMPLCGIHKTGGLSCQPNVSTIDEAPSLDDLPAVSSYQESFSGSSQPPMSQTVSSRKRLYDENDEADIPVEHRLKMQQEWLDGEISPRTMAPLDFRQRPMAVPRGRGGKRALAEGQENMVVDDFQDADFLDEHLLNEM